MTLEQKCEVIVKFHQTTPHPSLSKLVRWAHTTFSLPNAPSRATIMYVLRKVNDIKCTLKTLKTPKGHVRNLRCPEQESRLQKASRRRKETISWMTGFLKHHGLQFRPHHGEAASANSADIIEARMAMRDTFRTARRNRITLSGRGIWKLGTTGLKNDKTRITLALAANAENSEKCNGKETVLFKGNEGWQLGYYYRNNKKAWMPMALYTDWVRVFDNDMTKEGRQILLLHDNASSHVLDDTGVLTNNTVQILPPNTTSHLQQKNGGIIAASKSGYRIKLYCLAMYRALRSRPEIEPTGNTVYYVDQLQSMKWVYEVWINIKKETIAN
ncbi:LOW QUALITY PROTEIN: hypothetical protein PHMEG_0001409 [Phytophthora megakarya]|uniref:DDE-1 domain-containing protein n=1 Tax=Phytophthora megakarya TaxID=4795 RepID=A0A225X2V5_9STRA|nr:LOW QUALITY PROTEIN: hypothetical protein PHMEG_0001409 [Phytophthora megakarya]